MVGRHHDMPDSEFDPYELELGIQIELEHTDNIEWAKEIAKDHLVEIKDYYTRLIKMEEEAKISVSEIARMIKSEILAELRYYRAQ